MLLMNVTDYHVSLKTTDVFFIASILMFLHVNLQTLVAETLVLAKTHGYVEKIENELEEEILQETYLPKEDLVRWVQQSFALKMFIDILTRFPKTNCGAAIQSMPYEADSVETL